MKKFIAVLATIALVLTTSVPAYSHSGGTNKYGCHAGSKPYHCHNSKPSANAASGKSSSFDSEFGEVLLITLGVIIGATFLVFMFGDIHGEQEINETLSYDLEADPINKETKASASIKW